MDYSAPTFYVKVYQPGSQKGTRVGVDVDANLLDLTFEDSEKTHKLKLTVDNFDLRHFDTPIFKQGDLIEFSFGYAGDMSPPRQAVVTKVTGGIRLTVEALGKEYLMNKELRTRTFENKKRSDVAKQIAQEQGFGPAEIDIEDTGVVLPTIIQARMSDYQFLRDLANREGYEVFIDATGFHFHRRKLGAKPILTFTYYTVKPEQPQTGMLLAFPNVEIDVTAKPGGVTVVSRDPLKKKDIKARGDNESTQGRDSLAAVMEIIENLSIKSGESTEGLKKIEDETRKATEAIIASTATTKEDATRQANGVYQKAQMAAVKFKVPAVGNPYVTAKTIAKFDGIGPRLGGRYYLATVTHKLSHGSYTMELDARRDGTNQVTGSGGGAAQPSPQELDSVQAEYAAFKANLDANPDLKNDPYIQQRAQELEARKLNLEKQAARANAGAQNKQEPKKPGELQPKEVLGRDGASHIEFK